MVASNSSSSDQDTTGTPKTPSSVLSSSYGEVDKRDGVIEISAQGDIVLHVEHQNGKAKAACAFRVGSAILKANSKYFERLLHPGRFGEAASIEARHMSIRDRYGSTAEAPSKELPLITIEDIGRISTVKSIDPLMTDFFYILHGKDIQQHPPVANLANLAIVADRFDALGIVKSYVRRKKMIKAIDGKTAPKSDAVLSEEKVRQRLLVAILLDYPLWLEKYSARLIVKGWIAKEQETFAALWWDLPSRVEEEVAYRRECVLETVQSLPSHFLALYTSRERQCKLGYDSSAQCDSFQLGEMMRFFARIGTFQFQGTIIDLNDPPTPYAGDLYDLLDKLKQVPEYQIDRFHTHCGIRTRITPLLDSLQECLQYLGICPECWRGDRREYAWIEQKRPLIWRRQAFRLKSQEHGNRHADVRAMFTATERDWS